MKRALLATLALAAALAAAMLCLAQRTKPAIASMPGTTLPALAEPAANAVKLSYVELEASPHRTEQPGATQVYGWVTRGDDGQPVSGGTIRLVFEDCSLLDASAAESHATGQVRFDHRRVHVQEDGGWFVDLPGKCWIRRIDFTPRPEFEDGFAEFWGAELVSSDKVVTITPAPRRNARSMLIRTSVGIDRPLERDALEVTFAADPGIKASGLVFDAYSGEPVPGAQVWLKSLRTGALVVDTGRDGGFELGGIDPDDLTPENGMLTFLVGGLQYEHGLRKVAWEPGQVCIPAFKVVLQPKSR